MKLSEVIRREKELMSPLRWKINYVVVPLYLAISLLPLFAVIPLMIADENKYTPVFIVWIALVAIATVALLCSLPFITRKEVRVELERYSYLFKEPSPIENDCVVIRDEEITYTLDREGIRVEWPKEGEQVFDEVREDAFFIAWDKAELCFATQTHLRRVHMALAVFPFYSENDFSGPYLPQIFVPISEESFSAIKAFGLGKDFGADWTYLFYNPEDAFKQILTKGRIIKMRNKKTGKVFVDARGNFIGDEEK